MAIVVVLWINHSLTYYADVNKRIIRYNVNSDSYSFAFEKE